MPPKPAPDGARASLLGGGARAAPVIPAALSGATLHVAVALLAAAANVGLVAGGLGVIGDKYTTVEPSLSSASNPVAHIMSPATAAGVAAVLVGAFAGPAALGWLLVVTAQRARATGAAAALGGAAAVLAAAAGVAGFAWHDLVRARHVQRR